MAGMIEQSIISKLLEGGSLDVLHTNSVSPEMFLTCGDEIAFILKHYEEYKQVPDKITFLSEFREFQMLEVSESMDYLVYKLKEAYTYTKIVPIIQNAADRVREDSIDAITYLKEQIAQLEADVPVSGNKDGYDIITKDIVPIIQSYISGGGQAST